MASHSAKTTPRWSQLCVRRSRAALAGPESKLDVFRVAGAPESIRPILEFLPVEMMSLAFASLANRAPGKFELNTKVTTVE
jgi:hypothetical protein